MSKELAFTDDNDVVKYLDTTTAFNLALTADGVAFDLTNAKSILVKIANDDGYIMQQTIDLTTVTSPLGGTLSFPINQDIMNTLVPDDYDIEVWVTMNDGTQAIFPSDGTLGFSIEDNLMSDTGEVIPVITFDQFEDQFDDMMAQMQNTVSNAKKYVTVTDLNNGLSTKVTDNKDNTVTANNVTYDLSASGLAPMGAYYYNTGSFNALPLGTGLADGHVMKDSPDSSHYFITTTFYADQANGGKEQIAIATNTNLMYFRVGSYNGSSVSWNSWVLLSDDSKVVHSTDMRKPASDVAGIEEVNAKQDKIGYTPADDSKVVHDNHDGTISVNGANILPANENVIGRIDGTYTDMNDIPMGWWYLNGWANVSGLANWGLPQDFYYVHCFKTNYALSTTIQIAYGVGLNNTYVRTMSSNTWTTWKLLADDSKVAHLSGANNFDTVPTVDNNPLLLASSLPSDLARTGSNQEFTGKNTFDIAPIDKTTGNPYITKDGVPSLPPDLARTGQANTFSSLQTFSQGAKMLQTGSYSDANSLVNEGLYYNTNSSIQNGAPSITTGYIQVMSGGGEIVRQIMYSDTDAGLIYDRVSQNGGSSWGNWIEIAAYDQMPSDTALTDQNANFTAKLQKSGIDVATTTDVKNAVNTATANMVDTTKPANFTAGLQKGGIDVATAADLKSVEESAWRQLDNKYIIPSKYTLDPTTTVLYKINDSNHTLYLSGSILVDDSDDNVPVTVQLGSIIKSILTLSVPYYGNHTNSDGSTDYVHAGYSSTNLTINVSLGSASITTIGTPASLAYVTYDKLV